MNGECWPAILTKVLRNVIRDTLCANEDEDLGVLGTDNIEMLD